MKLFFNPSPFTKRDNNHFEVHYLMGPSDVFKAMSLKASILSHRQLPSKAQSFRAICPLPRPRDLYNAIKLKPLQTLIFKIEKHKTSVSS